MEKNKVCQLQKDTHFEGFLLVRGAEKKTDRNGRDYVDLNLGDRSGEINAKIWNWDGSQDVQEGGKPIKVRGLVQEYNGRMQMRIERWRTVKEEDPVPMEELVPAAPRGAEEMIAEIRETAASLTSDPLRKLTETMLEMAGERLNWFPAAQRMHHAERSGLLYDYLDGSRLVRGCAAEDSRSSMNVTFRTHDAALDAAFVKGAEARGLKHLKGHRISGGMRASVYNAMPVAGVEALIEYMREFEREHL